MGDALSACLQELLIALEKMEPSFGGILVLFYIKTFSFHFGGIQKKVEVMMNRKDKNPC